MSLERTYLLSDEDLWSIKHLLRQLETSIDLTLRRRPCRVNGESLERHLPMLEPDDLKFATEKEAE